MSGKIKVICHGCGARYQVRSDKVRGRRFRATCKKCGGIIVAHCTDAFTVMPGGSSGSSRPASAVQLDREDLDQDDDCTWYAVIGGKPHGPMNQNQIRRSFEQGQISERTYLWRAGDSEWRRFSEVADFASLTASEPTAYYQQGGEDPRQTSETMAAGPQGLRRQGGVGGALVYDAADDAGYDDPTDERTAFYQDAPPVDEMAGEATQFHVKDQQPAHSGQGEPDLPPQNAWQQVPVMPPRKAVLPSPTGTPMHPVLTSPTGESEDHTRPLTQDERAAAGFPPPAGLLPDSQGPQPPLVGGQPPMPRPTASTPSGMPVLTPALGPQTLAPVGGQPGQPGHLLVPVAEEEPFWSMGKIAAAAAIGGGLAVALAVVVVVSMVRPKQHTLVELPKTPNVEASKREIERTATEIKAKTAPKPRAKAKGDDVEISIKAPQPEQPKPAKVALAKAEPGKAETARPVVTRVKKPRPARRRVTHRRRPKRKRRSGNLGSEVDALLASGSRRSKRRPARSAAADADAILAAGTRPSKKAAPAAATADDILAAGTRPRKKAPSARPRSLDQTQIRASMRGVMPHVRNCYDKYGQGGLVKVKVTLKPNGKATGVVVGKLAGTPTGFCVLGGVYKARFPKFSGNPITFVYPFRLQ